MRLNHVDTFLTGNVHIAANGQVLTNTQRVRRAVIHILAQKFVRQITGCHHQRLAVHKLVGSVCRSHTRQFTLVLAKSDIGKP